MKEESIEDVLLGLIEDSDLDDVVCCLDFVARREGKHIKMFQDQEQIYPVVRESKE